MFVTEVATMKGVADIPVTKRAFLDSVRALHEQRPDPVGIGSSRSLRILVSLGVMILLVIVILVVALTPAPARIAPPATAVSPGNVQPSVGAGGVFVHVAGAVREPGLYELGPESRVADAIEAAGGALPKAEVDLVNLAQILTDGMKIEVPTAGRSHASAGASATTDAAAGTALVSINSAGLEELETLPGVGPVTAQAIISHREEVGPFSSLEGLLEVSGIGPATFAEIQPHVTL